MDELILRLEGASGPDSTLDHDILMALGARYELDWGHEYYWPDGSRFYAHELTKSVDHAIALRDHLLPDREIVVFDDKENCCWWAQIGNDHWDEAMGKLSAKGANGAVAASAAILRAYVIANAADGSSK
jgi:hypothetical protein